MPLLKLSRSLLFVSDGPLFVQVLVDCWELPLCLPFPFEVPRPLLVCLR